MPPSTASGGISRERSNYTRLSRTSGRTNLPEMASPAPSGRLQTAITYFRKVRKTDPKCRKRLITRKWCEMLQKKCTAASKASSNLSSEEYWLSFRIKRHGVSPNPTLWRASCLANTSLNAISVVHRLRRRLTVYAVCDYLGKYLQASKLKVLYLVVSSW